MPRTKAPTTIPLMICITTSLLGSFGPLAAPSRSKHIANKQSQWTIDLGHFAIDRPLAQGC
jgi:hypothetical protein